MVNYSKYVQYLSNEDTVSDAERSDKSQTQGTHQR